MDLKEFEKIQPQLVETFTKAFLECEKKKPGFMKKWFQAWAEGPTKETPNGC